MHERVAITALKRNGSRKVKPRAIKARLVARNAHPDHNLKRYGAPKEPMQRESPAQRYVRRMTMMVSLLVVLIFVGFPIAFLFDALGYYEVPGLAIVPMVLVMIAGTMWVYSVRCPDCGTRVTNMYPARGEHRIMTKCPDCGHPTSLPDES